MKSKATRKGTRGQALVELAVCVIAMTYLAIGIIEFGRMLMVASMITHAARDGARAAAVVSRDNRCASNGHITPAVQTDIQSKVTTMIQNVGVTGLTISVVDSTAADGTPIVTCSAVGDVPFIMHYMTLLHGSNSQHFNRAVTFRDEVSSGTAGC
jgi:Flp pilus assembly protein TadG